MFRRAPLFVLTLAALLATATTLTPAAAAPPSTTPDLDVEAWASGINDPWDVAFLPDGAALITEKTTGVVHVRHTDGRLTALDMAQPDFRARSEGGLLGIAVDPEFAQNRRFYTCQNSDERDVRVIRWRLTRSLESARRQAVIVDDIPMSSGRHSGCRLAFGYEGYLWIATGDAAIGSTPQNLDSLGGKVLRVDPVTGNGHSKNPFFTTARADRSKIYTYGHRNLQGLARRPCTSQMWSGEHGPSVNDEVNLLASGGNYGWNPVPGYNEGVPMTDFSLPGAQRAAKWRSGGSTIALSGIGWIRGSDWGGWDGELAGATLKNQQLWVYEFSNSNALLDTDRPAELNGTRGRLRVPVMGPDGSLYVASQSNQTVYRVTPEAGRAPGTQDINGDGYDDLVVGAPGKRVGGDSGAGAFTSLFGGRAGIVPRTRGSEARTQRHIKGATPEADDALGSAVAYGDIDGDGLTDVVVGSPTETVRGRSQAGAIHVICGRTSGVEGRSSQTFTQAGSVAGKPERNDRFGAAVVIGDFDGDGFGDVATGAPRETARGRSAAGAVIVLEGTASGLTTVGSTAWTQDEAGGTLDANDRFGHALAVGDFDNDGYDDLAMGAPGESVGGARDAGAVSVLFGSDTGLDSSRHQYFTQGGGLPGDSGADDRFGESLTVGDFDADGHDDLAIGAPGESIDGVSETGAVTVLFGEAGGVGSSDAVILAQEDGAPGANEELDRFGFALAAGDFDADGDDDLAVGSPGENSSRGRVVVLDGSATGLTVQRSLSARGPVAGKAERDDRFGAALRTADFDGDGFTDLAVGVPGETAGGQSETGAIVVIDGGAGGLSPADSRSLNQRSPGVKGAARPGDHWGSAL